MNNNKREDKKMTKKYYITHILKTYAVIEANSEAEVKGWIQGASLDDYYKHQWKPAEGDEYVETDDDYEKHYTELRDDDDIVEEVEAQ